MQAPGSSATVTENVEGGVDGIDGSLDALRHMTANAASETDGLKFVGLYKKLLKQQRDAKKWFACESWNFRYLERLCVGFLTKWMFN